MKLVILALTVFGLGSVSVAGECPNLTGTFKLTMDDGEVDQYTITQAEVDGITSYTVKYGDQADSDLIAADGVPRTEIQKLEPSTTIKTTDTFLCVANHLVNTYSEKMEVANGVVVSEEHGYLVLGLDSDKNLTFESTFQDVKNNVRSSYKYIYLRQ